MGLRAEGKLEFWAASRAHPPRGTRRPDRHDDRRRRAPSREAVGRRAVERLRDEADRPGVASAGGSPAGVNALRQRCSPCRPSTPTARRSGRRPHPRPPDHHQGRRDRERHPGDVRMETRRARASRRSWRRRKRWIARSGRGPWPSGRRTSPPCPGTCRGSCPTRSSRSQGERRGAGGRGGLVGALLAQVHRHGRREPPDTAIQAQAKAPRHRPRGGLPDRRPGRPTSPRPRRRRTLKSTSRPEQRRARPGGVIARSAACETPTWSSIWPLPRRALERRRRTRRQPAALGSAKRSVQNGRASRACHLSEAKDLHRTYTRGVCTVGSSLRSGILLTVSVAVDGRGSAQTASVQPKISQAFCQ